MVINRDKISDFVEPWNEEALLADGLESAFIGVAERAGQNAVAVYDTQKVIDVFVSDGMTEEEAHEHFQFNVVGAYMGENTPMFIYQIDTD